MAQQFHFWAFTSSVEMFFFHDHWSESHIGKETREVPVSWWMEEEKKEHAYSRTWSIQKKSEILQFTKIQVEMESDMVRERARYRITSPT